MTKQNQFLGNVKRYGATASISSVTGTACPCISWRGQNAYSAEWHRLNPTAASCVVNGVGTGRISRTATTVNIKAFFYSPIAVWNTLPDIMKNAIGEKANTDLIMVGTLDTDNNAFLDMTTYTEREDPLTYDGKTYKIREVVELDLTTNVGQMILLKRNT